MEFKAKDIASLLRGVVEGDENVTVNNVSKIEEGGFHRVGQCGFSAFRSLVVHVDKGAFRIRSHCRVIENV